jgi:hypothetical protein
VKKTRASLRSPHHERKAVASNDGLGENSVCRIGPWASMGRPYVRRPRPWLHNGVPQNAGIAAFAITMIGTWGAPVSCSFRSQSGGVTQPSAPLSRRLAAWRLMDSSVTGRRDTASASRSRSGALDKGR